MVKKHLKRIAMPKTWQIKRKGIKFITRPNPGAHNLSESMPLNLILKQILGIETTKESKAIIYSNDVLVNGIARTDHRFNTGLLDVISFPKTKKHYRIILNNNAKLDTIEIPEKEAKLKPCKILDKTVIKGNKIQLNLHGGINITLDKNDYKTGDTLIITFPKIEIKEHIKFEKDSFIMLSGGKYAGKAGTLLEIEGNNIKFKSTDGNDYETLKRFAFVIGKKKASIKIE